MKSLLIIPLLFLNFSLFAQSEADKEKAIDIARKAIRMMDEGQIDESIELLEQSEKLDPKNSIFPYEIGYALYAKKEYKAAIKKLEKSLSMKGINERFYQLIGNAHDNLGNTEKALKAYKKGLKKFPKAGNLYTELGILEYNREDYTQAAVYWETGIEVEPEFSSNYYWLTKLFAITPERIWAVQYGEMFINLNKTSARTQEISKIIHAVYLESINIESDTSMGVSFSKKANVITISKMKDLKKMFMRYEMVYEMMMTVGLVGVKLGEDNELNIADLNRVRETFLTNWYSQKKDKKHPNLLFDYQQLIKEKGYFEPYNYFLFMEGNPDEFKKWYEENEEIDE